jgi:chromatin assembly factor 1 subunit B
MVGLPHRTVFAVATLSAVIVYDTEQQFPVAMVGNLHYDKLTDIAW